MAVAVPLSGALADGPSVPVKAPPPTPPPLWTWEFGADGVYAAAKQGPDTLLTRSVGTLDPITTSNDFNFDREFGGDVRLRLRNQSATFEARYFGGFGFNGGANADYPIDWDVMSNPFVIVMGSDGPLVSSYKSRLHSAEANLRWQAAPNVVYFAGARWIQLRERMSLKVDTASLQFDTSNRAIGPQIGVDWRVIAPAAASGFFVDADARLGWLFNDSSASMRVLTDTANGSSDKGIVAAEAGLTLGYQVSPNAEWRLGYRALWLDSVALAPQQLPGTNFTTGTVNIARDDYLVHGVTFGFVVRH